MIDSSNHKGKFIVIEGLDGAGTTTQAKKIYLWLQNLGKLVFLTREPSDGPIGFRIRLALRGRIKVDRFTLARLFAADRIDHIFGGPLLNRQEVGVVSLLEQGYHVVSDRYYLSSLAYQSIDCDFDWIAQINSRVVPPDLTVFLDVPVNHCVARMQRQRGFTLEMFEKPDELEKVRGKYIHSIDCLRAKGERIQILDGTLSIKDVFHEIRGTIGSMLIEEDLDRFLALLEPTWEYSRETKSHQQFLIHISDKETGETVSVNFWPTTGNITDNPKLGLLYEKVHRLVKIIRPRELDDLSKSYERKLL